MLCPHVNALWRFDWLHKTHYTKSDKTNKNYSQQAVIEEIWSRINKQNFQINRLNDLWMYVYVDITHYCKVYRLSLRFGLAALSGEKGKNDEQIVSRVWYIPLQPNFPLSNLLFILLFWKFVFPLKIRKKLSLRHNLGGMLYPIWQQIWWQYRQVIKLSI